MLAKFTRAYLPIILIVLLASVLRLWQLGNVPISLSDDEIRLVYNGYSIAHSGKDVFGNFMPVVFKMDKASSFGQVPIYLEAFFFHFLPLNGFIARLPFAISGILTVVFIYFIVKKITNNKGISIASSFVLSINVWDLQITRFAIETDIALLMYLAGICIFLYSGKKIKLFLLSMLFFFLGFYTYAAYKVTLIPIIVIIIWYRFKDLTKNHFLIAIATVIIAFGSFGYLTVTQQAASYAGINGSAFFFQDKYTTSQAVELERRASNEPNFIETMYHSKFTYWSRIFATNYLTAFSPQYLFLNQEANGIYSIWGRGEFYIFELPLVLFGAFYLFVKKRKEFLFLLGLLLISPLPSAVGINAPSWVSRSSFMIPWLCIFIGAGIYSIVTYFKNKNFRYLIIIVVALFYIYGVLGYLSQYYFDWSQTNAKYFSKSTKDLIFTLNKYKEEGKNVIVAGANDNTFMHYAFYNNLDPRLVQQNINKNPIKFANFSLYSSCLSQIPMDQVYIATVQCKYKQKPSSVIRVYGGPEVVWNIYGK